MIIKIRRYVKIMIAYFFIGLFSLLFSAIIQSAQLAQREFRGEISENAIAIDVKGSHGSLGDFINTVGNTEDCKAIYKVFPYAKAQAVWFGNEATITPPVISGAFFSPEHLMSNEYYAVVGKEVYDSKVQIVNGKETVYFNTKPCFVIGVLGYDGKNSEYDESFFINMGALSGNEETAVDGEYIVDYWSYAPNRYSELLLNLKHLLREETIITQFALSKYVPTVMDVLKDDAILKLIMLSVFMVLFASLSIVLEWIEIHKKEIAIRKQIGATTARVTIYLYLRFIIISVIALFIALPIYLRLNTNVLNWFGYPDIDFNESNAFVAYAIYVGISLLGSIPMALQVKKIVPQALAR